MIYTVQSVLTENTIQHLIWYVVNTKVLEKNIGLLIQRPSWMTLRFMAPSSMTLSCKTRFIRTFVKCFSNECNKIHSADCEIYLIRFFFLYEPNHYFIGMQLAQDRAVNTCTCDHEYVVHCTELRWNVSIFSLFGNCRPTSELSAAVTWSRYKKTKPLHVLQIKLQNCHFFYENILNFETVKKMYVITNIIICILIFKEILKYPRISFECYMMSSISFLLLLILNVCTKSPENEYLGNYNIKFCFNNRTLAVRASDWFQVKVRFQRKFSWQNRKTENELLGKANPLYLMVRF